jgi:hypothetical protein
VINSAIVFIINSIWFARNQARFKELLIPWRTLVSTIISRVSILGNYSNLPSNSSLRDFAMLKDFNVSIHPSKAHLIKEVIWDPPISSWIKCNTDASNGPLGHSSY